MTAERLRTVVPGFGDYSAGLGDVLLRLALAFRRGPHGLQLKHRGAPAPTRLTTEGTESTQATDSPETTKTRGQSIVHPPATSACSAVNLRF
jgi:hypothetical protein